jgi:hypothetical protein
MYMNNASLRGDYDEVEYTEEMTEELIKCINDPIYFIENYIKIISAQKKVLFKLREYQITYINLIHENSNVMCMWGRQSGKSVSTAAYIAWKIIFNPNVKVLLLADQQDKAVEQLKRIKEMIEGIPLWMQMGVKKWAEKRIIFSNNSEVRAAATHAKAASGYTVNFLYLDEFALVDDNIAQDFMLSVFPTVSSDPNAKIAITSTPRGKNNFYRMWEKNEKKHRNGTITGEDFITFRIRWNDVPGRDDVWRAGEIEKIGEIAFKQEYDCEFEGSLATLVHATFIKALKDKYMKDPLNILDDKRLRIFSWPIQKKEIDDNNYEYLITVDPAMGTKQDFTVAQVWLIRSNTDIEQVAIYQSNDVPPDTFVAKILALCKMYHNPYVIIETMEPAGGIILGLLLHSNNYYNVINMQKEGVGFRMTHEVKIKACTLLQVYFEKQALKLRDEFTYGEIEMFGKKNNTFRAIGDNHDDCVMSVLSMLYYVNSPYFYGNMDKESIHRKPTTVKTDGLENTDDMLIKEALSRMTEADDLRGGGDYGLGGFIIPSNNKVVYEDAVRWKDEHVPDQRSNPMFNPHAGGNMFWHNQTGY